MFRSYRLILPFLMLPLQAYAQLPGVLPEMSQEAEKPPAPASRIEPEVDLNDDSKIADRLRATYGLLDAFRDVRVNVRAGVVELAGDVPDADSRQDAEALALQVRGVVAVENNIQIERDFKRRLRAVWEELWAMAYDVAAYVPLVFAALFVLVAFWLLGKVLTRWDWLFCRLVQNVFLRNVIRQIVSGAFLLAGIVLALRILDAVALVSAVLGAAGLVGLVFGLGFRDLAENYIAGVLLSLKQPFLPHDLVIIEGHEGKVIRLTSRATVIMTYDGNHVRVPNATVFKGVIRNLTRNPARRFDFTVGVGTQEDLARAMKIGVEAIRTMSNVLEDPPPDAWLDELADWNVVVHFFGWIDSHNTHFFKTRSEAMRIVKEALESTGVSLPVPIYSVEMKEAKSTEEVPPGEVRVSEVQQDLAADHHLDKQVAEDRAESADIDLLATDKARKD